MNVRFTPESGHSPTRSPHRRTATTGISGCYHLKSRRSTLPNVIGATSNLNRESLFIASLAIAFSDRALAIDVWTFHGACKDSIIKQDSSYVDNQDSAISCDAGYIMELGNGRKVVQFGLKQSELVPPGFAGGAFKYLDGHYALVLDTVYPQRVIAGKTTEQIYSETMKTAMPTEGYCFFNDANFSKLTQISCIAKAESEDTNISYNLTFEISDITVKRYNEGSHTK